VLAIEGDQQRAQVDFDHHGHKWLVLSYARLSLIQA